MNPTTHAPYRRVRALAAAALALVTVVALPSSADALAPANDQYADRITLTVGVPAPVSTVDATMEEAIDYEAVRAACGLDLTGSGVQLATVWYEFTPTVAADLIVQVTSPDGGFAEVVTGDPGSFVGAACSFGGPVIHAVPGQTYRVMATNGIGGPFTGTIVVTDAPPPPPAPSATINALATLDIVTNTAQLSGTITCSGADTGFVDVVARQRQGRFTTSGLTFGVVSCDGTAQPFSAPLDFATGPWRGGSIDVTATPVACNVTACTLGTANLAPVRLKIVRGTAGPVPPPTSGPVNLTLDRTASLDLGTNIVTLSGTFSCSGGGGAAVAAGLRQTVQRTYATADSLNFIGDCDGVVHPWSMEMTSFTSRFSGGQAEVTGLFAGQCTNFDCTFTDLGTATVQLIPTGHPSPRSLAPGTVDPGLHLVLEPTAQLDKATNTATIAATLVCGEGDQVSLLADLSQRVGRVGITAGTFLDVPVLCDGTPQRVTLPVTGQNGTFKPGPAVANLNAGRCTPTGCFFTFFQQRILLRTL